MSGLSLLQKTDMRRRIDRQWVGALSPSEMRVLLFVFTITIEWGKAADRVKVEHIRDGFGYAEGTLLSDKTIRRSLERMVDIGVMFRKRTPYGGVLGINLDWNYLMHLRQPKKDRAENGGLKEPKRVREIGQNDLSRSVKMTDALLRDIPSKVHTLTTQAPSATASVGGHLSGVLAVRSAEDRVKGETKKKALAARSSKKLNLTEIKRVWFSAWTEMYPEQTPNAWTARDEGMARTFFRYEDKERPGSMVEQFDWIVRNWRLVMVSRFKWMTDNRPPDFPTLTFLLKFRDQFLDAWRDRERLRAEADAKGKDRRLRKMVHHRGLTPEEAAAQVDAVDKDAELRAELARVKRQRDVAYQRADAAAVQRQRPTKLAEPKTLFRPRLISAENSEWRDDDI